MDNVKIRNMTIQDLKKIPDSVLNRLKFRTIEQIGRKKAKTVEFAISQRSYVAFYFERKRSNQCVIRLEKGRYIFFDDSTEEHKKFRRPHDQKVYDVFTKWYSDNGRGRGLLRWDYNLPEGYYLYM